MQSGRLDSWRIESMWKLWNYVQCECIWNFEYLNSHLRHEWMAGEYMCCCQYGIRTFFCCLSRYCVSSQFKRIARANVGNADDDTSKFQIQICAAIGFPFGDQNEFDSFFSEFFSAFFPSFLRVSSLRHHQSASASLAFDSWQHSFHWKSLCLHSLEMLKFEIILSEFWVVIWTISW